MDIEAIRQILQHGESDTVEAKTKARDVLDLQRTACAMANSNGGHIIVGVEERTNPATESERFRYNGIVVTRGLARSLGSIGDLLVPPVKVEVDQVPTAKNQAIFVIGVPKCKRDEAVSLKDGSTYRRIGAINVKAEDSSPDSDRHREGRLRTQEEITVLEHLLHSRRDTFRSEDIEKITAMGLDRIEAQLEVIEKRGLLTNVTRTSQGLIVEVSNGDRIQIEKHLAGLRSRISPALRESEVPSTEVPPPEGLENPSSGERHGVIPGFRASESPSRANGGQSAQGRIEKERSAPVEVPAGEHPSEAGPINLEANVVLEDASIESGEGAIDDEWKSDFGPFIDATGRRGHASSSGQYNHSLAGRLTKIRRESAIPALNATEYGEVVASLLAGSGDDEAMTFALFGHWGRGKTFQMKKIADALDRVEGGPVYSKTWFSAWKYRSTPETWIYLFQRLLHEAKTESWAVPWRASFYKAGPWAVLLALLGLNLSLLPTNERASLGFALIQVLGFGTVIYLLWVVLQFRTAGLRLARSYSLADHSAKLGMQSAIGDDLKLLLQAWMPKRAGSFRCTAVFQFVLYVVLAAGVSTRLWPVYSPVSVVEVPFVGELATQVNPYAALVLWVIWTAFALVAPFVLFWPRVRRFFSKVKERRVLLIIDDLDRCEPTQMLDIIESTLLILDDPEIKCRLQVAILVDEVAFECALAHKYDMLLSSGDAVAGRRAYELRRLVRENQEKFFLLQLRLQDVRSCEVEELALALAADMVATPDLNQPRSGPIVFESGRRLAAAQDVVFSSQAATPSSEQPVSVTDVVLREHERDQLSRAIKLQLESCKDCAIGPRSINCMLHRYQMAREILRKNSVQFSSQELAGEIVREYVALPTNNPAGETLLARIARQVS